MDWTNKKIIKFIQAIETYPVLWDSSHRYYKIKNVRRDAIQELAQRFDCDSNEVMRKWKIILAQYRREKKRIAASKFSASGISDIYKPKWFAYAYLNFIHGRDEPNASVNDEMNELVSQDIQNETANVDPESPHEMPVEKFKAPKNSLQRRNVDEDPRIAQALSIMNKVNKQMEEKKPDDDDIFAAAVAMKLRKIKDEQTKILVQRNIDNLLYDAIIGKVENIY